MSDINWQQVETLIDRVLDLPEGERKSFIENECKGQPKLKGEVTQMLESIFDSEGWLEDPADYKRDFYDEISDDVKLISTGQSLLGTKVGSYTIKEKLGEGGMGTVYLAERSGDFEHRVAIKIIRGSKATPENIRRFKREQRILAGLNHQGIARLFDAGITDDGVPYIIMEYVDGTPIDDYCKKMDCTLKHRIQLFEAVLEAVRYAHENLVIHRDLKPGNILVDQSGKIKILDFGISKLLEDEQDDGMLTQTGARLLTPRYAAPEQVRQQNITTSTDLYALGIVFYQLLSGTHPFDFADLSRYQMEQAILEQEAGKPSSHTSDSSLQKKLLGDLDAIALKAIRKEADKRYRVANEFLDDLHNYQKGLPVTAREDSFRYRSQKFITRHKQGITAATGILFLIIGLIGFYTWRISQERDQAKLEAEKAEEVTAFLINLFESNDPKYSRGDTLTAKKLLDTGKEKINELNNQPAVKARMLEVLGNIYGLLSDLKQADSLKSVSLSMKKNLYTSADPELASIYYSLALTKHLLSKYEQSAALLDTAITYQRNIYGRESIEVGRSLKILSESLRQNGKIDSSYSIISQANTIFNTLGDTASKDYLEVLMELGSVNKAKGNLKKTEQIWRQSLKLSRNLYDPPHPLIINNLTGLAGILKEMQKFSEAESLYIKSIDMTNRVYGPMHINTAVNMNNLAGLYYDTKKYEEASTLYDDSYAILKKILGEKHSYTVSILYNMANLQSDLGNFNRAEKKYMQVIRLDKSLFGENHPNIASDYSGLASLYKNQKKYKLAIQYFRKSLEIRQSVFENPYHPYIGFNFNSMAEIFTELGNYKEAGQLYEKALNCFVNTYGEDHDNVKQIAKKYAAVLKYQHKIISSDSLISKSSKQISSN